MRDATSSFDAIDGDFQVSYRESEAPAVPYDLPPRSKYTAQARHRRRRTGQLMNGAHRRRVRRSYQ